MWTAVVLVFVLISFITGAMVLRTKLYGVWDRVRNVEAVTADKINALQAQDYSGLLDHLRALRDALVLRDVSSFVSSTDMGFTLRQAEQLLMLVQDSTTGASPALVARIKYVKELVDPAKEWTVKELVRAHRLFFEQLIPLLAASNWSAVQRGFWLDVQERATKLHNQLSTTKTVLILIVDELRSLPAMTTGLEAVQHTAMTLLTHAQKLSEYLHAVSNPIVALTLRLIAQTQRVGPLPGNVVDKEIIRPLQATQNELQQWEQILFR